MSCHAVAFIGHRIRLIAVFTGHRSISSSLSATHHRVNPPTLDFEVTDSGSEKDAMPLSQAMVKERNYTARDDTWLLLHLNRLCDCHGSCGAPRWILDLSHTVISSVTVCTPVPLNHTRLLESRHPSQAVATPEGSDY